MPSFKNVRLQPCLPIIAICRTDSVVVSLTTAYWFWDWSTLLHFFLDAPLSSVTK